MKLLIVGDIHGQLYTLVRILRQAEELYGIDGAIQVGDFGFYSKIINQFRAEFGRFRLPVYAIDGNHEDHEHLALFDFDDLRDRRLHYMPRGSTLSLDGARIGFCGGALHADRPQELNVLTDAQADAAAAVFNTERVDLMVTHSCPSDIRIGMTGSPEMVPSVAKFITKAGYDAGPLGDCGDAALRRLWVQLRVENRPKHWVFGHFHTQHQKLVGETMFTCVGSGDRTDGRLGQAPYIFDTHTHDLTLMGPDRIGAVNNPHNWGAWA